MSGMFRLRGLITSSLLIAAALAAGCGSDDDESASSAKSPAASAAQGADEGFTSALAVYERYKEEPAPLEFPPLGSKPEAGKSLAVLSCPIPACKLTTENVAMAAQQLGWKPKVFVSQFSPESYQKTWDQMLQSDPDFIAAVGLLPSAAVEKQLAEAEEKDIKVVMISPNGDAPGAYGVDAQINGKPLFAKGGEIAANLVIADAKGKPAKVAMVSDPNQGQLQQALDPLAAELKKNCGDCSAEAVDINLANPPAQNAQAVVSFLQRNPDVSYVFYTVADAALGVPDALASAGLADKVKIITLTPNLSSLENIKKGSEFATIQDEVITGGWRAVDALARLSIGEGLGPQDNPTGEFRIIDKSNVEPGKVPDSCCIPDSFTEAWGAGA